MTRLKTILLATDFSASSDAALGYALTAARRAGAVLHVLNVQVMFEEHYSPIGAPDSTDLIEKRIAARVGKIAEDAAMPEIVYAVVRDVAPAPGIIGYTADQGIDLLIMGTHGRRGVRRLLMGSVAEEVVRLAPCPVMTIREEHGTSANEALEDRVHRIVVPVDFSDHSRFATDRAVAIASDLGAEVELVHVVEELLHPAFYTFGATPLAESLEEIEARALSHLRNWAGEAVEDMPTVNVTTTVLHGTAPRTLADHAENADLLVIATHGLTGMEHLLMGSVTEKLVRLAACPVLVLKPFATQLRQRMESTSSTQFTP